MSVTAPTLDLDASFDRLSETVNRIADERNELLAVARRVEAWIKNLPIPTEGATYMLGVVSEAIAKAKAERSGTAIDPSKDDATKEASAVAETGEGTTRCTAPPLGQHQSKPARIPLSLAEKAGIVACWNDQLEATGWHKEAISLAKGLLKLSAALQPLLKEAQRLGLSGDAPDGEKVYLMTTCGDVRRALAAVSETESRS